MILLIFLIVPFASAVTLSATFVYGQSDFTTGTQQSPTSASTLNSPRGVIYTADGTFYAVDTLGNRILRYPPGSNIANMVYGQQDSFTTIDANKGGISASSLRNPNGIALSPDGYLFVADTSNNRVLRYPSGSNVADRVYGQNGCFTCATLNLGSSTANTLVAPSSVAVGPDGRVYIGDTSSCRVIGFAPDSIVPDRIWGLPTFTSQCSNTVTDASVGKPQQIAIEENVALWVADFANNRVLRFPLAATVASRVYGQPDMTSSLANNGGISANSLSGILGVTVLGTDASLEVIISDTGNNRLLYYKGTSTAAIRVYGQPNMTSAIANNGGVSATSLKTPGFVYRSVDSLTGHEYFAVGDIANFRAVAYNGGGIILPTGNQSNVCYHHSTLIQKVDSLETFTMKQLLDNPEKYPDCRVAHQVGSRGVILHFYNGYKLQVTENHLVAYETHDGRRLYKKAIALLTSDRIPCLANTKGYCLVKTIEKLYDIDTYFGLNCINSEVYANKILTSTFENYHTLPALWMKFVGQLFGIEKASRWGDKIATIAYDFNLI